MSCVDCYNNCGDNLTSDQCTKYTGVDIPAWEICTGDPLSLVINKIREKLLSAIDGVGIIPTDVSLEDCTSLEEKLGDKEANLSNILQAIIDQQCEIKAGLDTLLTGTASYVFDKKCLTIPTGVTTPSRDQLLQYTINALCAIKSVTDTISTTYVKQGDLITQVTNIINTPSTESLQYSSKMVPYVAYEYYGPLSNFNNGVGISSVGFAKVFLCNGQNGTPDKRGRVAVGATKNVPGPALDSAVDPTNPINPNTDYSVGDKFGENYHKLSIGEVPTHGHTITDPGHDHDYTFGEDTCSGNNNHNFMKLDNDSRSKKTKKSTTGITLGTAGGDQSHNNRQPSIAALYIMYIPN